MHFGLSGIVPIAVYLTAIGVFLASLFSRPQIGLYFVVPLFPLQSIRYKVHDFPLGNKLIDIILLGVVLGIVFRRDWKLFSKTPLNHVLLISALFLYVSLWQGSYFLGTNLPLSIEDPRFSTWKNYMIMPLIFVLVVSTIKSLGQIKMLVGLMCLSTLAANQSVYQAVGSRNLSHFSYDIRDGGVFGYAGANGAGAFDAWIAVFLLALAIYEKRAPIRYALAALACFSAYCLMLTFSRGAYFGFLAAAAVLGLLKERRLLILLAVFLFTWQTLVPRSVTERIEMTRQDDGQLETSAADRVTIWEDATRLIPSYPILGTGFNTYAYMHRVSIYADTHNYYLKVLVETGAAGLLLFLLLLAKMFAAAVRLWRRASDPFLQAIGLGVLTGIIALAICNLFGDRWTYIEVTGFLWVLTGCVVRGLMIVEQEEKERAEAKVVPPPAGEEVSEIAYCS